MIGRTPSLTVITGEQSAPLSCELAGLEHQLVPRLDQTVLIATSLKKKQCAGTYLELTHAMIAQQRYFTVFTLLNWELYRYSYFQTHMTQGNIKHQGLAELKDTSHITVEHLNALVNLSAPGSYPYRDVEHQGKEFKKKNGPLLTAAQEKNQHSKLATIEWKTVLELPNYKDIFNEICKMYFDATHPLHTLFKPSVDANARDFVETKERNNRFAKKTFNPVLYHLGILAFILEECAGLVAFGIHYRVHTTFYPGEILSSIELCLQHFIRNTHPELMTWRKIKFSDDKEVQSRAEGEITPPQSTSPPKQSFSPKTVFEPLQQNKGIPTAVLSPPSVEKTVLPTTTIPTTSVPIPQTGTFSAAALASNSYDADPSCALAMMMILHNATWLVSTLDQEKLDNFVKKLVIIISMHSTPEVRRRLMHIMLDSFMQDQFAPRPGQMYVPAWGHPTTAAAAASAPMMQGSSQFTLWGANEPGSSQMPPQKAPTQITDPSNPPSHYPFHAGNHA